MLELPRGYLSRFSTGQTKYHNARWSGALIPHTGCPLTNITIDESGQLTGWIVTATNPNKVAQAYSKYAETVKDVMVVKLLIPKKLREPMIYKLNWVVHVLKIYVTGRPYEQNRCLPQLF